MEDSFYRNPRDLQRQVQSTKDTKSVEQNETLVSSETTATFSPQLVNKEFLSYLIDDNVSNVYNVYRWVTRQNQQKQANMVAHMKSHVSSKIIVEKKIIVDPSTDQFIQLTLVLKQADMAELLYNKKAL